MSLTTYAKSSGKGLARYLYNNPDKARKLLSILGKGGRRLYGYLSRRSLGRGRRAARLLRGLPITGFPSSKKIRLRYSQVIQINPAAGGIAAVYMSANGMYQPNLTSGGHQPLGFDQWMSIYDHYTVVGSKIKVRYMNATTSVQTPGVFGIFLDDNQTLSYTTPNQILEGNQPNSRWAIAGGVVGGGFQKPEVSLKFSASKFFGTKGIVGKDTYKGNSSSNPSETANFCVWMGTVDGSNDPGTANFMVTVEYIAVVTERKFLAQS